MRELTDTQLHVPLPCVTRATAPRARVQTSPKSPLWLEGSRDVPAKSMPPPTHTHVCRPSPPALWPGPALPGSHAPAPRSVSDSNGVRTGQRAARVGAAGCGGGAPFRGGWGALPCRFWTRMSLICPMSSSRWNQSHSCAAMKRGRAGRGAEPGAGGGRGEPGGRAGARAARTRRGRRGAGGAAGGARAGRARAGGCGAPDWRSLPHPGAGAPGGEGRGGRLGSGRFLPFSGVSAGWIVRLQIGRDEARGRGPRL